MMSASIFMKNSLTKLFLKITGSIHKVILFIKFSFILGDERYAKIIHTEDNPEILMINLIPFNLKLEKHHLREEEESKSILGISFLGSKHNN